MRSVLRVDHNADRSVHDLARLVEDEFERAVEAQNAGDFTYKSDIVNRMTDPELQTFETELLQASVRMRQIWYAIQAVYHRSPEYPAFYAEFVEAFGMARADQILRTSGRS